MGSPTNGTARVSHSRGPKRRSISCVRDFPAGFAINQEKRLADSSSQSVDADEDYDPEETEDHPEANKDDRNSERHVIKRKSKMKPVRRAVSCVRDFPKGFPVLVSRHPLDKEVDAEEIEEDPEEIEDCVQEQIKRRDGGGANEAEEVSPLTQF